MSIQRIAAVITDDPNDRIPVRVSGYYMFPFFRGQGIKAQLPFRQIRSIKHGDLHAAAATDVAVTQNLPPPGIGQPLACAPQVAAAGSIT